MKVVLQNLTKIYPSHDKGPDVTAVNNFNFEIPDGKLIGLLGPSGCGKSTTLNLISGLETPTSGKIFFGDDDVTDLPPEHRGVGLVFQSYALYPHMTVLQNILFPLENMKGKDRLSKEEMNAKALEAAHLVQIEQYLKRKPAQLSGGQQQRVAIARALVKRPRVLLLDEPLSNLDARLRLQTREEIRRIQRETGITTVFVTHDQEEAMSISDKIVVMRQGIKMQEDAPQEVYRNPNSLFVAKFLGNPPINVFKGSIKKGTLYIGEEKICKNKAFKEDKDVYVGIRPEGFLCDEHTKEEDKVLSLDVQAIQTMGRDMSLVCDSACKDGDALIKIIIDSEIKVGVGVNKFAIRPTKMFVFDGKSEERIYLED